MATLSHVQMDKRDSAQRASSSWNQKEKDYLAQGITGTSRKTSISKTWHWSNWSNIDVLLDMIHDEIIHFTETLHASSWLSLKIAVFLISLHTPFTHSHITNSQLTGLNRASSMPADAQEAVRNFLASLQGGKGGAPGLGAEGKLYPLLNDLLETSTTVPMLHAADEAYIDNLLSFLPPVVVVLAAAADTSGAADQVENEPSAAAAEAARATMSLAQKKALLEKVLRSPQFHQSLASLSMALRDGGLPTIAEALQVKVENGGYVRGGSMPLGAGEAVEAFVEGVKKSVQEKQ